MRLLAATLLTLLVLTGCSDQQAKDTVNGAADKVNGAIDQVDLPKVDWGKYQSTLQDKIDRFASQGDCRRLKAQLAKAEPDDTDLTAYVKARIRQVSC